MRHVRKSQGFTLVELLVVLAILTTVMGISVTLMFTMFDFQQRYAEQSEQLHSTNRFIEQFRSDARLYHFASIEPDRVTIEQYTYGNMPSKITYSLVQGKFPEKRDIVRRVWQGDKLTGTETYHLPDYAELRFVEGTDDHAGQIALSLWEQPPDVNVFTPDELDPFTRTLRDAQPDSPNPGDAVHWRTVIVRVAAMQETGDLP